MFRAATLVICAKKHSKIARSWQGLRQLLLSSVQQIMAKDVDPDNVWGSYSCHLCRKWCQTIWIRTRFNAATLVICARSDAKNDAKGCRSGESLGQLLLSFAQNWNQKIWIRTRFRAATLVICAKSDGKRSWGLFRFGQGLGQLLLSSVQKGEPWRGSWGLSRLTNWFKVFKL